MTTYDFLRVSDKLHRYFSDDTSNLFPTQTTALCAIIPIVRDTGSMSERNVEGPPSKDFAKFMIDIMTQTKF